MGAASVTVHEPKTYVRVDGHGVLRVGATGVMLDSVAAAFRQGHSPETIRQQYPALSLEEVYGALTYYLAHSAELEAYLRRQDALWERWRERSEAALPPVVQRLRTQRGAPAETAGTVDSS